MVELYKTLKYSNKNKLITFKAASKSIMFYRTYIWSLKNTMKLYLPYNTPN